MSPAPRSTAKSAAATSTLIEKFGGGWYGHGRALKVTTGGAGQITYRVYTFCSSNPTPPCDEMQGNQIIDGGRISFTLDTAYAAGTATIGEGSVTTSTDPKSATQGEPVTVRLQSGLFSLSIFPNAPFCGANAPTGECGA